ncbi:hypothetical protein GCM10009623_32130 [Nocardioides aestuarii]|uniref:Nuclear transport factor 2 family protein n=1 Tax=Nocardioides aestuarii TaxID=252231 RepID=A0ABW4TNZ0_9ACTN
MTRTHRPRLAAASLAALVALSLGACSGEEESPEPDAGPSLSDPSAAPTLEVEPVVRAGEVVGRLTKGDRTRIVEAVSGVAVRYLDAAFLAGDYPRQGGFQSALAAFAPGTAKVARGDLGLLTNAGIAPRVDEVTPAQLGVTVDVLAVREHASAATAHVKLVFKTAGDVAQRVQVQGRLMMTKADGRWQVFAYHLSKGAR